MINKLQLEDIKWPRFRVVRTEEEERQCTFYSVISLIFTYDQ